MVTAAMLDVYYAGTTKRYKFNLRMRENCFVWIIYTPVA